MKKSQKRKALLLSLVSALCISTCGLFACSEEPEGPEPEQNNVCSHVYLGEVIITAPTCTEDGQASQTCMKCGNKETYVKYALGHSYENGLQSNETEHWGACDRCGHEEAREPHVFSWVTDETSHTYKCDVCEYVAIEGEHTGSDEYLSNATSHYHFCDVCEQDYGLEDHSFVNNTCGTCDYVFHSTGLSYKLVNNGTAYSVTGIGTETGVVVGIPSENEGLPVVAIDSNAFAGNADIQTVIIPSSVTRIEQNAFNACTALDRVSYGGSAKDWAKIDFVTVGSNPLSNGAELYASNEKAENIDLTEITTLRAFSFTGCTSLKSVKLGSVNSIGNSAFRNCTNLETITVNGATSIGSYAFKGCEKLKAFAVPAGVTTIGEEAFIGCKAMETLTFKGNNVYTIGVEAFKGATSLKALTLPASIEFIGKNAFENCNSLKTATIATNSKLSTVEKELFKNCTSLESVTLSGAIEVIEENAFFGCSKIKKVTLPANLNLVNENAFKNCSAIDEVRFDGVLSAWFKIDFANKEANPLHATADLYNADGKITELSLPENCAEIKKYALINCTSVEKIIASSTLSVIGTEAMSGCVNLKSVSTTGSNVRTISEMAFYGCEKLSEISWSEKIETIGTEAFYGCASLTVIDLKNATKLETIGARAFKGCLNVKDVYLPAKLNTINQDAFNGLAKVDNVYFSAGLEEWMNIDFVSESSNPMYKGAKLYFNESIVGVLSIGDDTSASRNLVVKANTFVGCESLTELYIKSSVERVEFGAFKGCKNIRVFSSDFIGEQLNSASNNHFGYIFGAPTYADNKKYVPTYIETVTLGEGMTSFASYAFYGCDGIETITIPNSIDNFGVGAFEKTRIANVLYNYSMVAGDRAWAYKKFANETSNPLHTGANLCHNYNVQNVVTSLTIVNATKRITPFAFVGSKIESVVIDDYDSWTFEGIGESAFKGCSKLELLELPFIGTKATKDRPFGYLFGAKTAEENGIYVPSSLKIVKIDDVEVISANQFYNCRYIKELNIGRIVNNEVGRDAFYGCSSIEKVTYFSSSAWSRIQFANKYANPLHSGAGLYVDTYQGLQPVTKVEQSANQVGQFSYYGCTTITEVYLRASDQAVIVGESAFENCSNVQLVQFINNTNNVDPFLIIGDNAFKNCPSIERVDFHSEFVNEWFDIDFANQYSNPLINGVPLYYLTSNVNEPVTTFNLQEAGITVLKNNVLAGCTSLEYIDLKGVTDIERGALYGCTSLNSVFLPYLGGYDGDVNNEYLGYVFGATNANENVKFVPDSLKEVGLYKASEITASAFKGASRIEKLHLPGNKMTFREGAFADCNVKEVYFVIDSKTSLVYVHRYWVESTFESFDSNPLHKGASLTIGNNEANNGEPNREKIEYIDMDWDIFTINPYAYAGCGSIKEIRMQNSNSNNHIARTVGDYAFKNCFALTKIVGYKDNMTFGFGALEGTGLSSISLFKIGSNDGEYTHLGYIFGAETYLENESKVPSSLKNVYYYGDGKVDDYAFYGCKYLNRVTIKASVPEIGASAFENCSALEEFMVENVWENSSMLDPVLAKIGENAFANCKSLSQVRLPSSLESTGYGAFMGCRSIRTVGFAGTATEWATISFGYNGNPLESGAAFCPESANVNVLKPVENIEITFVDGVDTISAYAFKGCSSIVSVTLTGVKHIGDEAFAGCAKLKAVVITDKELSTIGIDAFYKCTSLESVNLGDTNLLVVSERAFGGCLALKEITIPNTVTYMGETVFNGDESLVVIINQTSKPTAWEDNFADGVKEVKWNGGMTAIGGSTII